MIKDRAILSRAYKLWEKAGKPKGKEELYWLVAQREIEKSVNGKSGPFREIANDLSGLLAAEGRETPAALEGVLDRHGGSRPVQLPLPLRGRP